jgi:hypothetical protein
MSATLEQKPFTFLRAARDRAAKAKSHRQWKRAIQLQMRYKRENGDRIPGSIS